MKIKDIKVGTQLWIGLGLILAFVFLLSLLSWKQNDQLWLLNRSLYDHPLQVTQAIGRLKADISSFRMEMRDLLLAKDERATAAVLEEIETYRTDIARQVAIIADRYPRTARKHCRTAGLPGEVACLPSREHPFDPGP